MRKSISNVLVLVLCFFALSVTASSTKEFVTKIKFTDDDPSYTTTVEKCADSTYHFLYTKCSLDESNKYVFQFKSKQTRINSSELGTLLNSQAIVFDGYSKSYEYNELKNEGWVSNNIFVGKWVYYSAYGKKCLTVNYGALTSKSIKNTYFNYDGSIELVSSTDKSGAKHGAEITFYSNGNVKTIANYVAGNLIGNYSLYDSLTTHPQTYRVVNSITSGLDSKNVIQKEFDLLDMQFGTKDILAVCKIGIQKELENEAYNEDLFVSINEEGIIQSTSIGSLAEINASEVSKKRFKTRLGEFPIPIRLKIPLSLFNAPDPVLTNQLLNKEIKWVLNNDISWARELSYKKYRKKLVDDPVGELCMKADVIPIFPGGEAALMKFLGEKVTYPEECLKQGVQGRIFVSFVITKTGDITSIAIAKGAHPLLNQEAMRVVGLMPKWIPGTQRGKPVNVKYMLPVNFVLTESRMRR